MRSSIQLIKWGIFQIHLVRLPILNNNPDLWAYGLSVDEERKETKRN